MAKAYSVQAGFRAVDHAIQTHGGIGLINELGLVQAWQDLRIVNIADGTNEILTRMIAQRLQQVISICDVRNLWMPVIGLSGSEFPCSR